MPLIVRISFWKMVDFDARLADTPQELEELFAPMVEAGVDLFDCSQRRFWEPCFERHGGSDLNLAGWVKKVTGVPTCTIGSIGLDSDFFTNLADGKQSETEPAQARRADAPLRPGRFRFGRGRPAR